MSHLKLVWNSDTMNVWDYKRDVYTRIAERYGALMPNHFILAMTSLQAKPYMYGDTANVAYRSKDKFFNRPMPIPCLVTEDTCNRTKDGMLILGKDCAKGTDEAFGWLDQKYQVTLQFLRSLKDNTKLVVYTRSDLVAHDDYMNEFKRLDVIVHILYVSEDDEVNRLIEPGAPSYMRRCQAVARLRVYNIDASMKQLKIKSKYFKTFGIVA